MKHLVTATGAVCPLSWAGISELDGILRFECFGSSLRDVFSIFADPQQTALLTISSAISGRSVFTGYTLIGIEKTETGTVVRMSPPASARREERPA